MHTFIPNWQNVKPLGRTRALEDSLWLAFSGSGAEFSFIGRRCEVAIAGDNHAADAEKANDHVRIAVYLDGKRVVDDMIDASEKVYNIMDEDMAQEHVVRIVKLSETAMSTCGIKAIYVDANTIRPTPRKAYFIEFIGDSITCGYGVDDEAAEHHFATCTEDVTRTFACKTAQALDADYSVVAISGYGIISGYTATAEERVTAQLLPAYYDRLGFSYGKYRGESPNNVRWDFSVRQPDMIILNLGTNDDSYSRDDVERQEFYCAEYVNFLKVIRACNPAAKILCTLGIMGDRLYPFVEKAAAAYAAETGDVNIVCMPFAPQLPEDGYAADYHPTETTHRKAADKLTCEICRLMGW